MGWGEGWNNEVTQLSLALTVLFADIIFTAARRPVPPSDSKSHLSPIPD